MSGSFIQKQRWIAHALMAVAASLVILVVVFLILKRYGRVGHEYPTPYVVGSYLEDLDSTSAGLTVHYVVVDSVYQSGKRGGYILRQDPDSGAMIKNDRKIYLTVTSHVPDNAIVPDLRSLSVRHAVSQLQNIGLRGGRLTFVDDPHHVVLEQKYKGRAVAPGRRLEKGAMIDLVVGTGTGTGQTIVPYLVGMTPQKARSSILSASLNMGVEHFDGITDMSHAIVYKQMPEYSGRPMSQYGDHVELWYCDKSVVAMEELERMKQKQIEDSIRSLYEQPDETNGRDPYRMTGLDEF